MYEIISVIIYYKSMVFNVVIIPYNAHTLYYNLMFSILKEGTFMKKPYLFLCFLSALSLGFSTLGFNANADVKKYEEEVQKSQFLSRHWDESELKERFQNFLSALQKQEGIEDYIVPDINEDEKETIREFFRPYEKKELTYVHTKMDILNQVSGTDEYNDLRGIFKLTFRVKEGAKTIEHTVLMHMARLGDANGIKWKIYKIIWSDKGIDVSDVKLIQLEKPKRGEQVCIMTTDAGVIKMRLFPEQAPVAVKNWIELSKQGFYNGTPFARVIKDFVIQGGALDGSGDESKSIYNGFFEDEVHKGLYNFNGALCLGNNGPHTNGNQFYIVQKKNVNESVFPNTSLPANVEEKYKEVGGLPELDGRYTVLGQVYEGMDVVEKIAAQETDKNDAPVANPVKIQKIEFQRYR